MFYAHYVLARKGPLARIWLAAHWDKKLKKAHVEETNIERSVDGILQPKVKMALRTTGHLLFGIVRIYSRKANYLLSDCNEALFKIKFAFRPGSSVDLPIDSREVAAAAITLPDIFSSYERVDRGGHNAGMVPMDYGALHSQLSLDLNHGDITLHDEWSEGGRLDFQFEEGFGEIDATVLNGGEDDMTVLRESLAAIDAAPAANDFDLFANDDQISGRTLDQDMVDDLTVLRDNSSRLRSISEAGRHAVYNDPGGGKNQTPFLDSRNVESPEDFEFPAPALSPMHLDDIPGPDPDLRGPGFPNILDPSIMDQSLEVGPQLDVTAGERNVRLSRMSEHTTLLHDADEMFALEPVDASIQVKRGGRGVRGPLVPGRVVAKRRRRLVVDRETELASEYMKLQMALSDATSVDLDLAPPTKKLMWMQESGATDKIMTLPGRRQNSKSLVANHQLLLQLPYDGALDEAFEMDFVPSGPPLETPLRRARKRKEVEASEDGEVGRGSKRHRPLASESVEAGPHDPVISTPNGSINNARKQWMANSPCPSAIPTRLAGTPRQEKRITMTPRRLEEVSMTPGITMDADQQFPMDLEQNDLEDQSGQPTILQNETEMVADHAQSDPHVADEDEEGDAKDEAEREDRLNKRAKMMTQQILSAYKTGNNETTFMKVLGFRPMKRKQVAQAFFSLLVLQKESVVIIDQSNDDPEIRISPGPKSSIEVLVA